MRATSMRRLLGGAAALLLIGATLLSAAGVATAQSPVGWSIHVQPLPDKVTPGADAGYQVTISNIGPSNISQLYLLSDPSKGNPTYVSVPSQGSCNVATVEPLCTFGALNAGTASNPNSVTVIVGYSTSGFASPFDPVLEARTGGVSFQDPHRSHGDSLTDPTGVTTLVTDKNFGGGFNGSVGNSDQLNGQNKQSEKVTHLPGGIGATVQDGTDTTGTCTPVPGVLDCKSFAGEWTILNVNQGQPVAPYFILQVHFRTGTPTVFVHSASALYPQEVIQLCTASAFNGTSFVGTTPCYTWDPSTGIATIYLFHNSPVRG